MTQLTGQYSNPITMPAPAPAPADSELRLALQELEDVRAHFESLLGRLQSLHSSLNNCGLEAEVPGPALQSDSSLPRLHQIYADLKRIANQQDNEIAELCKLIG